MSDLIRDELAVARASRPASVAPSHRAYAESERSGASTPSKSVAATHRDSVQISAQARLRSAAIESHVAKAHGADSHGRVSLERLERIKRFYAAGNMRPNPQAIARHLWSERHGL